MSSSETRLRIVKLDDNNYAKWKGNITGALMSATLDEFINPDAVPVAAPTELLVQLERKVLYEAYVICQRKAAGIMYSHMTQAYRIIVESEGLINKPLAIWTLMKEKFQSTTSGSKGRAYASLIRNVYQSLSQYIKDTRASLANMHACGINFTDDLHEIISEMIVAKLPNTMETTLSILAAKQPLKTKTVLDTLDAHLIEYNELHLNESSSMALATMTNRPNRPPGQRFPYPTCTNGCHNPAVKGHRPNACWVALPELRPANVPPPRSRATTAVLQAAYMDDLIETSALSCQYRTNGTPRAIFEEVSASLTTSMC
ncbi:uncharacterized protein MELLADRAFT_101301 [Melampsora larici-populina 98AG31]|uniref:Uncharacterized protein n=1 Tax=Melampsora larici-populina (strain 98AG31 / pathotype 3-4-7) TaxID=747676 RepID=F4R4A4_MELLP|nr:uncharacterized protein MELLADRAFT_101301 [Melampsora larici-populina 98AG31]EGG13034.1 hypothetical protein MELLADRAFT_101301 [Melampsora larici-populina 98AG31]